MREIVARSWDQIPPVIQDDSASISTRYLVYKYRAMQDAMLEFVAHVENGEVISKHTYEKFKQILQHIPISIDDIKPGQEYMLDFGAGNTNNKFIWIKEVIDEGACIVIKQHVGSQRTSAYEYVCKDITWFQTNWDCLFLQAEKMTHHNTGDK